MRKTKDLFLYLMNTVLTPCKMAKLTLKIMRCEHCKMNLAILKHALSGLNDILKFSNYSPISAQCCVSYRNKPRKFSPDFFSSDFSILKNQKLGGRKLGKKNPKFPRFLTFPSFRFATFCKTVEFF